MRVRSLLWLMFLASGCASSQVITVQSNPVGAELRVDGKYVGKTPATFTDDPSDGHYYKLDFAMPGYKPVEKVIKQEQGKGTLACIGVAAGCCPLVQVCLLKSYTLPKANYDFDLEPDTGSVVGAPPPPNGAYPAPPPNQAPTPNAPPPPPNAPPPPESYPMPPR